jgi:hypothetical protein
MTTGAERNVAAAEAYYHAMNANDLAGVASHLHPDVQFVSPMVNVAGKEAVLEAVKRFRSRLNSIRVHTKFGSELQAILIYDVDFGEPIGISRTAALIAFKDNLISRIELFYDARPFEKNLRQNASFSSS